MRNLGFIAVFLGFFLFAGSASATTYYVDYASGADTNNGTAKATPWQHAKGMNGCSNTCSSTTLNPGDSIIFKGGVTWPNIVMTWTINTNGTNGNNIYYGVDQTWYAGGSWTRPIFNAGGVTAGTYNNIIILNGSYVTLDNLEFTNMTCGSSGAWGSNFIIDKRNGSHRDLKNLYVHGWVSCSTGGINGILSDSHYPSPNVGDTLEYSVFDGSDTADTAADPNCTGNCYGQMAALYGSFPIVHHNVFRYVIDGHVGSVDRFNDNLIEYLRREHSAGSHGNGFENNSDCGTLFYNNVIRHTGFPVNAPNGGAANGVTFWIAPDYGCTDYVWNNVIYDTTPGNVIDISNPVPDDQNNCTAQGSGYCATSGTIYLYNNTVECGPNGSATQSCGGCPTGSQGCTYENNHLITSYSPALGSGSKSISNVIQTQSAANSQGYTVSQTYGFSPTSGTNATVGVGTNLTSSCTGSLTPLCNDTTYGVVYKSTTHNVSSPARTASNRGSSWDAGAYQFGSSSVTNPPVPPAGLAAVVN